MDIYIYVFANSHATKATSSPSLESRNISPIAYTCIYTFIFRFHFSSDKNEIYFRRSDSDSKCLGVRPVCAITLAICGTGKIEFYIDTNDISTYTTGIGFKVKSVKQWLDLWGRVANLTSRRWIDSVVWTKSSQRAKVFPSWMSAYKYTWSKFMVFG